MSVISRHAGDDASPRPSGRTAPTSRRPWWHATLDDVPLIVLLPLTAIVILAGALDSIPENMIGGLALITGVGMLLGPIGNRLPIISKIGGGALICLMLPSVLVYFDVLNENMLAAAGALLTEANFLYFVICALVVGSILGMQRSTMLKGLVKIFPPLIAGTLLAVTVGVAVAMAFGYSFHRALFFIVVPIIGGGIGEGVIPLSAAYSSALGGSEATYVAELIPAAVIGNIVAIISAGLLKRLGERRRHLSGDGRLVPDEADAADTTTAVVAPPSQPSYALGVLTICALFTLGTLLEPLVHLPAPVLVIVFAVLCKLFNVFPSSAEESAKAVYAIVSKHFIFPLMVGLGMLYIPLENMLGVLSFGYVVTCTAVVLTMGLSGFLVGRFLKMFPVDASIVTLCHSGLGGTGDVAILSASDRMSLMPFAQISTRVGGVTTVIAASSLIGVL